MQQQLEVAREAYLVKVVQENLTKAIESRDIATLESAYVWTSARAVPVERETFNWTFVPKARGHVTGCVVNTTQRPSL